MTNYYTSCLYGIIPEVTSTKDYYVKQKSTASTKEKPTAFTPPSLPSPLRKGSVKVVDKNIHNILEEDCKIHQKKMNQKLNDEMIHISSDDDRNYNDYPYSYLFIGSGPTGRSLNIISQSHLSSRKIMYVS